MAKFVPKQKMSKKAQRALNAQSRVMWDVNPITRKVESKKIYNRKKSLAYTFGTSYISQLLAIEVDPSHQIPLLGLQLFYGCI